ncbi:BatD family protein [Pseudomonas sp. N040]|uniref:BatD family protein n=1 Tax=Pseudomonas sp. N040 TaxID=2785325 RepID=UPI0018A2A9DA|nr:BatD family protein [Pseudomonas sp. N040]MBF7729251.1 BatD family protein [Pseudomonas sp. N040]MBW7012891.1 BatD family protein [Pseudomonas sp. N040]
MRYVLLLVTLLACMSHALAEPLVRVDARLQPAAPYQVGGTLRLEVDLLTSTWFTQAPQPAPLDLPGTLITPPNGQADSLTLNIDGSTWFGLRLTYLISPTAPGQYEIPALPFSLNLGQAAAPINVSTRALSFTVSGAAATGTQGNRLVASQVRMSQQVEQSADPLKVGDRVTRRIRIEADGAQAMLIPPVGFSDIPGLKRYPQPPTVGPLGNGRGSIDGGVRIDSVSYVVEQAGDYRLPELELNWSVSRSLREQTSQVPAIEFEARRSGDYQLPFSLEADLEKLGRGRLIHISRPLLLGIGSILLLGLIAYLGRQRLHEACTRVQGWRSRRQATWHASERCAWRDLQRALRRGPMPLAELYRWQLRSQGHADLQALARQLPAAAATCLQQALTDQYSAQHCAPVDLQELRHGLQKLRKHRIRRARAVANDFQLQPLRPWTAETPGRPGHDTHT